MITYGYSLQGKSHIDRNTVCQDSSAAVKLKSGYYLGVVADGVGSAPHSDVGSGIAVESLDRKSTRLNSSHTDSSRMPSSA